MCSRLVVAATAAMVLAAGSARADDAATDGAASIAWDAPQGCPSEERVRQRVVANLKRALQPGEVDAQLHVSRVGSRWRVEMTVRTAASGDDAPGVRELDAASCDELAESAALILAMTIEDVAASAEAAASTPAPPPVAEPVRAAPTPAPAVAPPPPAATPRGDRNPRVYDPDRPALVDVRVRALVGGDVGSLPSLAPGVGGAVEVAIGEWSGDITYQRFAERDALMPGPEVKGAHVGLTTVAARGCLASGEGRMRTTGCVGGEVNFTTAEGFNFGTNFDRSTTPGGGPQLGLAWAVRVVGPVAARVDFTATWLAVRTTLREAETMTIVHDPDTLVWRGFSGFEVRWR